MVDPYPGMIVSDDPKFTEEMLVGIVIAILDYKVAVMWISNRRGIFMTHHNAEDLTEAYVDQEDTEPNPISSVDVAQAVRDFY